MTKKPTDKLFDSELAQSVRDSAQQIWLAGLGAFAKAQQEGSRMFDSLIKEGTTLQQKTRGAAEERLGDVGQRMSSLASDVSARASRQLDRLESMFDERIAKALGRLDAPTRADFEALKAQFEELKRKVTAVARAPAKKAGAAKTRPVPRRAAKTGSDAED